MANERIKNRIVVDLNQPSYVPGVLPARQYDPTHRKRRRWPRILAVLMILCLVVAMAIVVGGYFWWRSYQSGPAYSVALIIDAAQRNDMAALQNRLDDDAIAKNLVGSVRDKASSRYGVAISESLQQKIDGMLPALLSGMKQTIHIELAKEIKDFSSRAESKPFIVVALTVSSFATITTDGDNAKAIAPLPDRVIEVTMRRDGDRWKVVDFKDDVMVQRIVDAVIKDLPAIGGLELQIPKVNRRRRGR